MTLSHGFELRREEQRLAGESTNGSWDTVLKTFCCGQIPAGYTRSEDKSTWFVPLEGSGIDTP